MTAILRVSCKWFRQEAIKGNLSKREEVDGRPEGFSLRDIIVGSETGTESVCWLRILGDGAVFK